MVRIVLLSGLNSTRTSVESSKNFDTTRHRGYFFTSYAATSRSDFPVPTFHIRTVPYLPPVASLFPSKLKTAELSSSCDLSTRCNRPVATSHSFASFPLIVINVDHSERRVRIGTKCSTIDRRN